jgi:GxxExxY protein
MKEKSKPEVTEGTETFRSLNDVTNAIIGAAIEVHRHLGPGLLESAYEECLCYELSEARLSFLRQVPIPVQYKGIKLDCDFRLDLLVENAVIIEIKTVDRLVPVHTAQLLTYLKATNKPLGLLINFNVPILKQGIKRVSNHYVQPARVNSVSVISASEPSPQPLRLSQRLRASAVKTQATPIAPIRRPN